ncbi:MAG: putative capsid protein [Cressdnaviricota sp.]|nr:MAG: putative capsid protein [Cressdnaviricota sp.]
MYNMAKKYKSSAQKNKKRIKRSSGAKAQQKQISSNQNQIVAIQKHLSMTKQRMRWHCGFTGVAVTAYPLIIPLTSGPSSVAPASLNNLPALPIPWEVTMTPSPQNNTALRSKVVVNKQYIDLTMTSGTESAPLQFTAFIVQLQPKVATQTYTDTAAMTSLTRNDDFSTPLNSLSQDSGYGAFMNNQKYRIIKRLEFETLGGASGGAAGSTGNVGQGTRTGILHRCQAKLNYGSTQFKSSGSGESSASLNYADIDPKQKRFIVIFSDNSLLDLQYPTVSMSCLTTGYAAE